MSTEQLLLNFDATQPPRTTLQIDAVTQAMAELALQIWREGPPSQERLQRLGWTDFVEAERGVLTATGPSGIRTSLYRAPDPIATAVCLALGQMGMLWPIVMPGYLKEINRQWQQMRKGDA